MENIDYRNIDKYINYSHNAILSPHVDFHLHEGYEIFFLLSGDVNYFVEKKIYPLRYGDLMITNNHEIHRPFFKSDKLYERICMEINPLFIRPFSSPGCDLLHCVINRPHGDQNRIVLTPRQTDDVLGMFTRLEKLDKGSNDGHEILKLSYVIELLVYINRAFLKVPFDNDRTNVPQRLVPIFDYIDNNLCGDLSLQALEKKFFIDRFYLCKLFKKSTGSNIHNYIIYKRISKAKSLLQQGASVMDTCSECGFNDYSNFYKMFKKIVGVSPGKYV